MEVKLILHDAEKQSPSKSGEYLVMFKDCEIKILQFSEKIKRFNAIDRPDGTISGRYCKEVVWWAEIPDDMKAFAKEVE